jgi:hypothetical protein
VYAKDSFLLGNYGEVSRGDKVPETFQNSLGDVEDTDFDRLEDLDLVSRDKPKDRPAAVAGDAAPASVNDLSDEELLAAVADRDLAPGDAFPTAEELGEKVKSASEDEVKATVEFYEALGETLSDAGAIDNSNFPTAEEYAELDKGDLEKLVESRRHALEVTGTGSNDAVIKDDLIRTLAAADEALAS